jgi:RNA polymerase sigma-70 factor (ECF subfamily)
VVSRTAAASSSLELRAPALGSAHFLGNTLRFESVYQEHAGFTWRVLRGMGIPDTAVEDAVQDVFVVVHRRLPEFDGRHSVRTWLFAIAQRVAYEHRRKLRRTEAQEPLDEQLHDTREGPEGNAAKAQALKLLETVLEGMSDDKRAVLVLAEIEGMSAPEIAAVVGAPLNTVYTRLRRARLELNAALEALSKGRSP